jgi:eukaryotic-like serine/threonine-protein kinase
LKDFQKSVHNEVFVDPAEVAPYRDVPRILSQIVRKSLSPKPVQRYHRVEELIKELADYIEGRSEWFQVAELHINTKNDWEFQENVLIAEHAAITRHAEVSDWVSLMVSKISVTGNTKVEAELRLNEKSHGIGFLLSIPEAGEREHLNDGYCLWLGSENYKGARLLRSAVEVMNAPEVFLERFVWYKVRIEKVETNIYFYLNDQLQFSYISHAPLVGTHVGIIARDANFEIADFFVYAGSQNIMVNCLAVPDAYLAIKEYTKALNEYRRIGYSFPGRAEGREAMFRAGVTLIEQANNELDKEKSIQIFDLALKEFEKLHQTPGAPLEYLGKALVYEALGDYEEEIKCFELACRRYLLHPMLSLLQEQIVFRMHESSHHNRLATYNFVLLVARHLPDVATTNPVKKLFNSLQKHWENLYFFTNGDTFTNLQFSTRVAFWIGKPYVLAEICNDLLKQQELSGNDIGNSLFGLLELGASKLAEAQVDKIYSEFPPEKLEAIKPSLEAIKIALLAHISSLPTAFHSFFSRRNLALKPEDVRVLCYLMELATERQMADLALEQKPLIDKCQIPESDRLQIDAQLIWAALMAKQWEMATEIFRSYSTEFLAKDTTLLHFLYGCWLAVNEGQAGADAHFGSILEVSFPRSWTLFSHLLSGKLDLEQWEQKAFLWEKRQLYRQGELYYHCLGNKEKANHYRQLAQKEYLNVEA